MHTLVQFLSYPDANLYVQPSSPDSLTCPAPLPSPLQQTYQYSG